MTGRLATVGLLLALVLTPASARAEGLDVATKRELWDALQLSEGDVRVLTSSLTLCAQERDSRKRPIVIVSPAAADDTSPAPGATVLELVLAGVAGALIGGALVGLAAR